MPNLSYNYYLKHPLKLENKRNKDKQQFSDEFNVNFMLNTPKKDLGTQKIKFKLKKKRIPVPQKPPKVISTKKVYKRFKDKKEIKKEMDFTD